MAACRNLTVEQFLGMLNAGLPMVILNVLYWLAKNRPIARQNSCVEFFSGAAVITKAFKEKGHVASEYDNQRSAIQEDILTCEGMLTCLEHARGIVQGGLAHWATVCSSWVWMCRGATHRTASRPEGDPKVRCVREGNGMVARMAAVLIVLICKSVHWVLEQPESSLMKKSLWMRHVLSLKPTYATKTYMGVFGGSTLKPTELLSMSRWPSQLCRRKSDFDASAAPSMVHNSIDTDGKVSVTGKTDLLKASQVYPEAYGREVYSLWKQNEEEIDYMPQADVTWATWRAAHNQVDWSAAAFSELAAFLGVPDHFPLPM